MRLPLSSLAIALCLVVGCDPTPRGGGPISDFPAEPGGAEQDAGRGPGTHDPDGDEADPGDDDSEGEDDGVNEPPADGDAGQALDAGTLDGGPDAGPADAGSADGG